MIMSIKKEQNDIQNLIKNKNNKLTERTLENFKETMSTIKKDDIFLFDFKSIYEIFKDFFAIFQQIC